MLRLWVTDAGHLDTRGTAGSSGYLGIHRTDNPRAAVHIDELFSAAAASLADFPDKGRLGLVAGTRELIPHENYRLVYQTERDVVWILAMVHVARMWPPVQS